MSTLRLTQQYLNTYQCHQINILITRIQGIPENAADSTIAGFEYNLMARLLMIGGWSRLSVLLNAQAIDF